MPFEIDTGVSAMRKTFIVGLISFFAMFLLSCGSSQPAGVHVIGTPEDLVPITGEWSGTFESAGTGRSGSITFHLTENPEGAHGDVLMVPKQELLFDGDHHQRPRSMTSGSNLLSIEFVRISGNEISGKIEPYPDPETPEATLETHFSGRLAGDWIEGTFVTYSDHGVSPRRGTWRVHRKAVR
jgi:hypothetical protein